VNASIEWTGNGRKMKMTSQTAREEQRENENNAPFDTVPSPFGQVTNGWLEYLP